MTATSRRFDAGSLWDFGDGYLCVAVAAKRHRSDPDARIVTFFFVDRRSGVTFFFDLDERLDALAGASLLARIPNARDALAL